MSGFTEDIEAALKLHPLCGQIVHFLIEHEGAMDTIHGVATCWVDSDEVAVKSALDCLLSAGVVVTQPLSSGVYYSLTQNPEIRTWIRVNRPSLPRAHALLGGANGVGQR
jgi:hypothetical protein